MAFFKAEKDPDSERTYTIDWANSGPNDASTDDDGWLQGDTISSSSWILETGIAEVVSANSDTTASIKVSGGILGRRLSITNRIVTAGGEKEDRTIELHIVQK